MGELIVEQESQAEGRVARRERIGDDRSGKGAADAVQRRSTGRMRPADVLALQRAVGNAGVTGVIEEERSSVHDIVGGGGGQAIDPALRGKMETALGADFGDVKIHSGPQAAASAAEVGAHAYTTGNNVVLGSGVDASSPTAQRTLAHELTHVVQQRNGPVDGTPTGGGIKVSDPSDRFEQEAERTADAVTAGSEGAVQRMAASGASGMPTLQREAGTAAGSHSAAGEEDMDEDEDADVQKLSVQREGGAEEEEPAEAP